ncbi:hypothetical protein D3C87_947960 [compost metagenome]
MGKVEVANGVQKLPKSPTEALVAVDVRDLADTFASLNLKGISDCDLTRVTSAVHLLMREGCAILNVIQARAVQREEAYKTPV